MQTAQQGLEIPCSGWVEAISYITVQADVHGIRQVGRLTVHLGSTLCMNVFDWRASANASTWLHGQRATINCSSSRTPALWQQLREIRNVLPAQDTPSPP